MDCGTFQNGTLLEFEGNHFWVPQAGYFAYFLLPNRFATGGEVAKSRFFTSVHYLVETSKY